VSSLSTFRTAFPALARISWLNTAAQAPGPQPVLAALQRAQHAWADGTFDWTTWETDAERARELFAARLNVPASTVALLSTLADAAATVAQSIAAPARIVVPAVEFRSNLFPWLALQGRGCEVVALEPGVDGLVRTEALIRATRPGVTLVAVSEVQSATGHRVNVRAIAEQCAAIGARCFVNLTQSAGVLRLDAASVGVDFAAAHSYKWLLAPRGATFLYVRPDRLPGLSPLSPNWKNAADIHDPTSYAQLYGPPYKLANTARRLDASLAWFPWVGARAALELLNTVSAEVVESHCLALSARFQEAARALDYRVVSSELPTHLTAIELASPEDANKVSTTLRADSVITSARGARVRFGFHAFTDATDVDRALSRLRAICL